MASVVVLCGGGIKSAVAAARSARESEVVLLHLNYGQTSASREILALEALVPILRGAKILRLGLPHITQLRSGAADPSGATPSAASRGVVGTPVVTSTTSPAVLRGLMPVMLTVGVQSALRVGAQRVVIGLTRADEGAHLGLPDAAGGVDVRREFLHACDIMIETWLRPKFNVHIESPWIDLDYAEVIKLGQRFQIPFDKTWTCERSGPHSCGQCDPCRTRSRAFAEAGLMDPASVPNPAATAVGALR